MTMVNLRKLEEEFLVEAGQDYVGLWQLVGAVRRKLQVSEPSEVRRLTLLLVRDLLASGLQAVALTSDGGCVPWLKNDVQSVINRIEREWSALGREPNIGEIVWFNLPD